MTAPSSREIREGMAWREDRRRKVFAVGRMEGETQEVAVRCFYCDEWIQPPIGDEPISHGLHEECADFFEREAIGG